MDDVLHAVDLYRRPVALQGGDLAAGDAPQQLDISQTHPCEWRTDKQEAVGHFSFLAAIALTEPVASTAARSFRCRVSTSLGRVLNRSQFHLRFFTCAANLSFL